MRYLLLVVALIVMATIAQAIEFKDLILRDDTVFKKVTAGSATFQNVSTNSLVIPQGIEPQSIELFEAAEYENDNKVIIKPILANISSNVTITIGNHGLYVNGVEKLTW